MNCHLRRGIPLRRFENEAMHTGQTWYALGPSTRLPAPPHIGQWGAPFGLLTMVFSVGKAPTADAQARLNAPAVSMSASTRYLGAIQCRSRDGAAWRLAGLFRGPLRNGRRCAIGLRQVGDGPSRPLAIPLASRTRCRFRPLASRPGSGCSPRPAVCPRRRWPERGWPTVPPLVVIDTVLSAPSPTRAAMVE